ncbi:Dam family site-specific DNA-(adenine-N6)-methyltransferase [uncultured Brachyspira sp.]|uniref:DNA adenine methylase n=1 Tax=uncultured Brachyspira sp. TaxID=221953 RepID=UPI002604CAD4|nr:Dam family site-specific DNA-(adenine-N6)-methyltransferase [uncultured Brachyspira sp.]
MNKKIIRSPLFYVGDKFKLIPQLNNIFPKQIDTFIEPFCGGGSVFLNINANKYIVNDIDKYVIKLHNFLLSYINKEDLFFSVIKQNIDKYRLSATYLGKNVPYELKYKFKKTYFAKYNKFAYANMRKDFNKNKEDIMLLYMLIIYGFNRMIRFNSNGDFNLPVGNVDFNKNVENAIIDYFNNVKNKNILLYNLDFENFLNNIDFKKNDFIYLDPPYLITYSEYNKNWNENDELRLINTLDKLNKKNIKFAVSNILWHKNRYNCIFNEWAQKYNIINISSNYISYHDNTNKNSIEVLVKNY